MPLPAESSESKESSQGARLEVMVVDEWLIFDCPGCEQTIKLDRKDSVHDIECPSCHRGFEPLLDREVKLPPLKGPARKRARRLGPRSQRSEGAEEMAASKTGPKTQSRPTSSSLPEEGIVKLTLTPTERSPESTGLDSSSSALPVRSALELERRRVESLDGQKSRQPDESELNAVIEEQSGGKYKRIRVRTRKKRLTEKQRTRRIYLFGGLAGMMVVILSLWGAAQVYKEDAGAEGDGEGEESKSLVDSEPIGEKLGHFTNVIQELKGATTVDQLLKLIRYPKRLEPTLRAYYGDSPVPVPTVRDYSTGGVAAELVRLPRNFSRYQLLLPTREIPIYMEKTKDFGYRLDWESYVGLGEERWEDFVEEQVTRTVRMRVYASDSNYFEGAFTKQRHYCLRLEDPNRDDDLTIYGYYERDNPKMPPLTEFMYKAGAALAKRGLSDTKDVNAPLMLDVRFPKGAKNKVQVEIVDFANDTWLKP